MDPPTDPIWTRWDEVNRLFEEALDWPEGARDRLLAERCGGDPELHEAVASLLRAETESQGRFGSPDPVLALAALADRPRGAGGTPPAAVGPYRVLEEIGRGGMGTIYRAERATPDFRQEVAVKVLRRGVDTDDVVRRFVAERRILAELAHPNIARLVDGGATPDGRPYLVMEYVEGSHITRYCDDGGLGVEERIRLFLEVVDAVRYAHTRLVVHRDLKPSNILVTPRGDVKLLDFGIAKLLEGDGAEAHTRTHHHLLTPEYASPEQLRGEPVSTASDVYQLGALLYLLLAGVRPSPPEAFTSASDSVTRTRPPSAVAEDPRIRTALRGDLDTIVLKAMHPEVARRYGSAEGLADDLRRYLEGRPVRARPDSLAYRTRRFLGRHRWVAPALVLALATAGSWLAVSARHTRELQRERNLAREEAERALEVQAFMADLFRSADPFSPADPERGRAITVVEALDLGAARAKGELAHRPRIHASLLETLAHVYTNLGQRDRARPLAERALAIHDSLAGPESSGYRGALGVLARATEGDASLDLFRRRVELATAATGPLDPEVVGARVALASRLVELGLLVEAEAEFRALEALADSVPVADSDRASIAFRLAGLAADFGRDDAESRAREVLELYDRLWGEGSPSTAMAREKLANVLAARGDHAGAAAEFARAIELFTEGLGEENPNTLAALNNFALQQRAAGEFEEAERLLRRLIDLRERIHGREHVEVGNGYQNLGATLTDLGRTAEAFRAHETAAAIYEAVLAPDVFLRGLPHLSLAGIHLDGGRFAAAEGSARRALRVLEATLPSDHHATAVARCRVGLALLGQGRQAEASPLLDAAAPVIRTNPLAAPYVEECLGVARIIPGGR